MSSKKIHCFEREDVEIYDCVLREGEQYYKATLDFESRIKIYMLLDALGVDYVELGWPLSSKDCADSFAACRKKKKKAKIVAFGSTSLRDNPEECPNLKSIVDVKPDVACIFGKSDVDHVKHQLKITKKVNLDLIRKSIEFLKSKSIEVFYDAEHFFDGFRKDSKYALQTLFVALEAGASRVILCDTNGGFGPSEVLKIVKKVSKKIPRDKLGVHFHDDSDLALANTLVSLGGAKQFQGTINGLGERVGNLNLSTFMAVLNLKHGLKFDLSELKKINESSFRNLGISPPDNSPYVGKTAFSHKGGVHIDAMNKGASYEFTDPEKYGNRRVILLNSLGGRATIVSIAKEFGYELDSSDDDFKVKARDLLSRVRYLEQEGYAIGAMPAEHFLLIEEFFGKMENRLTLDSWSVNTGREKEKDASHVILKGQLNDEVFEYETKVDGGPIEAIFSALLDVVSKNFSFIESLDLKDYHVEIAKPDHEKSSVRTIIYFNGSEEFETVGVSENIIESGLFAIVKGFNYKLNKFKRDNNE